MKGEAREPNQVPLENLIADDPALRSRIGRHLGGIRKAKHISQEIAAQSLDVSRPHLSNIESGRSRAAWPGLQRMADYYTQDIKELIEKCRAPDWAQATPVAKAPATPVAKAPASARPTNDAPEKLTRLERYFLGAMQMLTREEQQDVMHQIERIIGLRD